MTGDDRHDFMTNFAAECLRVAREKGEEYNVDGDVNGNFKRVAAKSGQTVLQVWNNHFEKHLDAINNYVKDPNRKMAEPIEGRITDAVNYLLILASLIEEKKTENMINRYRGEEDDGNID